MKILLPKTLAEPLTIGWPTLYGDGLISEWIIADLEKAFQMLEDAKLLSPFDGRKQYLSRGAIATHLKDLAEMRGAVDVVVGCIDIQRDEKWAGYMFLVHFRVPGEKKEEDKHVAHLRTYF